MSLIRELKRNVRLKVFIVGLLCGGIPLIFGDLYVSLFGVVITVVSLIYGIYSFSCPSCGCKWLLHFMQTSRINNWLHDLQEMAACPECGYAKET